ncbi:MAG: hypothetical protein AAB562_03015 [Patescibacteria group bacterium]
MNKIKFLIAFGALALMGAGCVTIQGSGGAADGGVYKSANKGEEWVQKAAVLTIPGRTASIASVNTINISADPQDPRALYLGTAESGLWVSYDGAESWFAAGGLARGQVPAVAVDPKTKCTIYAAFENKVMKSTDCSREFKGVYFDSRQGVTVTAVALDSFDPKIVYAGLSTGDLLKSADSGATWSPSFRFESPVRKILIDHLDTRIVYAATAERGIWKTTNAGKDWADVNAGLEKFAGSKTFRDMATDRSATGTLVLASQYGLLKTRDGGNSWEALQLLTPPGSATIYSLAVNPKDGNEMYYGTGSTFYKTANGGINWSTRKLPSSRAATVLHIDPSNPSIIYMGVRRFEQ